MPRARDYGYVVTLVFTAIMSAATARAEPTIEIKGSDFDRPTIQRIVDVFMQACPRLRNGQSDIQTIRIETNAEYAEHRLKRGWKTGIHIAIPLPQTLQTLPEFDDRVGVIAGHTLHYDIGSGITPGILGQKRVSHLLCDMPIAEGSDSFKPVTAFEFIAYP